jgi:LmbE family N-acetylglucosaminyl deacetylase
MKEPKSPDQRRGFSFRPRNRLLLLLLLAAAVRGRGAPQSPSPPPLDLAGYHRLLVLAPHCDDETLGAAGLIRACRRAGIDIRVVLETNGDGFLFATMEEFHKFYPRHQDFIRMGEVRQRESLQALQALGVAPAQVSFLDYPVRGTPLLWEQHWSAGDPYRSPYSGRSSSPYPLGYKLHSVYAGENLLADLLFILDNVQPDLICLPHPNDLHPDHWGLSLFARLAVSLREQSDPGFRPTLLAYLIHRPGFPRPKGFSPADALLPPGALKDLEPDAPWRSVELSPEDVAIKQQAVRAYASQTLLAGGLLESFVRRNELFELLHPRLLPRLAAGSPAAPASWRDARGEPIPPVLRDPAGDRPLLRLLPAADLLALSAALRPDGSLAACAELRSAAQAELDYVVRVTAVDASGVRQFVAVTGRNAAGRLRAQVSGNGVAVLIPAEQLGRPAVVAVEAEVREPFSETLDRTAWALLAAGEP